MSSISYKQGFYYVPRIDKVILDKYKEDIIVLTGNLNGEVPSKILNIGLKQGEESLLWWKEKFGDDLYIEIMRHSQDDENIVNEILNKNESVISHKLCGAGNGGFFLTFSKKNSLTIPYHSVKIYAVPEGVRGESI